MTAPAIADTYGARLNDRQATLDRMERRLIRVAIVRVVLGLTGVGLLIWLGLAPWKTLAAIVGLFAVIAVGHGRLINARDRARSAVRFYERGLARLRHEWPGTGDAGDRFMPPDHLYAADLDVFGRGSLFELIGTCRTEAGRQTLASWLAAPADPDEIRSRQASIRELTPDLDLREDLAVEGDHMRPAIDPALIRQWATAPRAMPGPAIEAAVRAYPVLTVGSLIWWLQGGPLLLFLPVVAVQGLVALALGARVRQVTGSVDEASRDLDVFIGAARLLEARRDTADRLQALRARLVDRQRPASASIAGLSQLVALLSSRGNVIFAIVAPLLLWTTQLAFAMDRWRDRHGVHVPDWLGSVAEFDALNALAGYAAEHPSYVFPDVEAAPSHVRATALAHPLLGDEAVANDVSLGGASPSLLIVSGSNMSGKSTLLRTLGLNVVLAQAGAPVRASSFALSPLAIGASIRVLDSLLEGRSRFYAEILRLKHIVDLARDTEGAALFLLDEVLSGTNSHDRRQGAEGLLRGLIGFGAVGLATTHDLALGDIAAGWSPQASNVHFADKFDGGSLAFDYVLRDGPVRTSNAIALMQSVGLDVAGA